MNLLDDPAFAEILADELAYAGLPEPGELGTDWDVVTAIELSLRSAARMYLDSARTQTERRTATATLLALGRYAATCFGPGDTVTVDWYSAGEHDRPEGHVLDAADRRVTVAWDNDRTEQLDARDLRHDHHAAQLLESGAQ